MKIIYDEDEIAELIDRMYNSGFNDGIDEGYENGVKDTKNLILRTLNGKV